MLSLPSCPGNRSEDCSHRRIRHEACFSAVDEANFWLSDDMRWFDVCVDEFPVRPTYFFPFLPAIMYCMPSRPSALGDGVKIDTTGI